MAREKIHRTILITSIALMVGLLPFSFTSPLLSLLFRISFIILITNWLLTPDLLTRLKSVRSQYVFWALLIFYAIHAIGLIYSDNRSNGIFQMEKKAFLVLVPLIVLTDKPISVSEFAWILKAFISSIVVASLICFGFAFQRNGYMQTFVHVDWYYFSYNDFTEIVKIQPNYLAIYSGFAFMATVYLWINRVQKSSFVANMTNAVLLTYLFVLLLLLAARAPLLAFLAIVFGAIAAYFYQSRKWVQGLVILVTLGAAVSVSIGRVPIIKERLLQTFGLSKQEQWISHMGDGKGGLPSFRLRKWKVAFSIIKEHWILGVGTGDVQDSLQERYRETGFDVAYQAAFNTHNQFLQTWVGLGVVGLGALLTCFAVCLFSAWKRNNYFYFAFIVFMLICSITESTLERQYAIVLLAVFLPLFEHLPPKVANTSTNIKESDKSF
jgi:O-antigen ligase